MPCLHSLRSWAMHFTFARLRLAGKMIISPRRPLGQIIFIGALINCLSLNNPLITTISGLCLVTEESIQRTIDSLEDEMQKDFIRKCLRTDPADRPTARELLFHPVLFEVHSLKLLAAHILVNTPGKLKF